ncbi:nucleoside deaminase, partial [Tropicimonas aquimaris]
MVRSTDNANLLAGQSSRFSERIRRGNLRNSSVRIFCCHHKQGRLLHMTRDQMIAHILAANAVARSAAAHGHHPFGAVLVGPDNTVLMRQGNIDTMHHAETELARRAAVEFSPEFLWTCTLVSTGEPCAMCTGTLYCGVPHLNWSTVMFRKRRTENGE